MQTKHVIITAATVLAAGIIGGCAPHGLLNRHEIFSEYGKYPLRISSKQGNVG